MKILVSGGTGYIGSHTCVELINAGHEVVIFDNLYNSKVEALDKIEKITNVRPKFYKADMTVKEELRPIFEENKFDSVIHFAGLKAVGESVAKPLMYYENNLRMQKHHLFFFRNGLRRAQECADYRGFSPRRNQSVR